MAPPHPKRAQPFTGKDKREDIEIWIDDCRLLWLSPHRPRVHQHYVHRDRSDWKKLAQVLKGKIAHPGVLSRMLTMHQGKRNLRDHVRGFGELASFQGSQSKMIGLGFFVDSLDDSLLKKHIILHQWTREACGKDFTVEDLLKAALKWEETDWHQMKKSNDILAKMGYLNLDEKV
ncbi:hypothetical protein BDW71DRAFT_210856 [Aspergillus fruticulosus]